MEFEKVKISTTVPLDHADKLRQALGEAGAGVFGEYTFCSFSSRGQGRFKASADADPQVGNPGEFTTVEEEQIEVICDRAAARQVVNALKRAHPYEEVILEVIPLLDPADL